MSPKAAALSAWISRLTERRPSRGTSTSAMVSRTEVRPPELWPSSRGWRGLVRRWMLDRRDRAQGGLPVNRLTLVKEEFLAHLADVPAEDAAPVCERIARARSLRELWHLRSSLFNLVACCRSQVEAERRLSQLNRHFPTRASRSGG